MDDGVATAPTSSVEEMFLTRLSCVASALPGGWKPTDDGSATGLTPVRLAGLRACDYCSRPTTDGWVVTIAGKSGKDIDIGWYCDPCLRGVKMEKPMPAWKPSNTPERGMSPRSRNNRAGSKRRSSKRR